MIVHTKHPLTLCLDRPTPRGTKGGTLIASEITDLASQHHVLAQPDLVRPRRCPTCGGERMHVHERRHRKLLGHPEATSVAVLVFRCARVQCRAVWRVLPGFLARFLRRSWSTVARAVTAPPTLGKPIARRTRQRWLARLRGSARVLIAILGGCGHPKLMERAVKLGSVALRQEVLDSFGGPRSLGRFSALVHRLAPGVRVM